MLGEGAPIDVQKLIESRLLVQANSGAGKSWALRCLLEQTYAHVQQIVIDVEGEFHTLRERFDYVLAGQKGGDCPADIKSAAMLARRLLELGTSAIVDIYELGIQRQEFVKRFLDALVNAPKELWRPVIVVIDEAHIFCPEQGHAVSADAVKDLMTRGRKRGFSGVLATQRISKLHKDAAAEANNKLIGRSALDIDMKRAAAELGLTDKTAIMALRKLAPGEFYAFGPALSDEVRLIRVGDVMTTHPKAGERAAAPTPPRDKVKRILAQLADLPHEAEEEARTVAEWKAKAKQLELDLRKAKAAVPEAPPAQVKTIERPVIKPAELKRIEALAKRTEALQGKFLAQSGAMVDVAESLADAQREIVGMWSHATARDKNPAPPPTPSWRSPMENAIAAARAAQTPVASDGKVAKQVGKHTLRVPKPAAVIKYPPIEIDVPPADGSKITGQERRVLQALAWFAALGITQPMVVAVAMMSDYAAKGGTFINVRGGMRSKGLITYPTAGTIELTDTGREHAPHVDLGTGNELRDKVLGRLSQGERKIMERLIAIYPQADATAELADATGYGARGGTFVNLRGRLRTMGIAEYPKPGLVRAADLLFPELSS
jgi:hypothetical protein